MIKDASMTCGVGPTAGLTQRLVPMNGIHTSNREGTGSLNWVANAANHRRGLTVAAPDGVTASTVEHGQVTPRVSSALDRRWIDNAPAIPWVFILAGYGNLPGWPSLEGSGLLAILGRA
jgi:hypothetical protein